MNKRDSVLVLIDDYYVMDELHPRAYTYAIHSCIALLCHFDGGTILAHIFADERLGTSTHIIDKILENYDIKFVEIFVGPITPDISVAMVINKFLKKSIPFQVAEAYREYTNGEDDRLIDIGEGSLGFDYNDKSYHKYNPMICDLEPAYTRKLK